MKYLIHDNIKKALWIIIIIHSIWLIYMFAQLNSISDLQAVSVECPRQSFAPCENPSYNNKQIQHPIYTQKTLMIGEKINYNPLGQQAKLFNISVIISLLTTMIINHKKYNQKANIWKLIKSI